MTEARLLLATIAQRWRLVNVDAGPPGLQPIITLRPKGGLTMRVEKRQVPLPVDAPAGTAS